MWRAWLMVYTFAIGKIDIYKGNCFGLILPRFMKPSQRYLWGKKKNRPIINVVTAVLLCHIKRTFDRSSQSPLIVWSVISLQTMLPNKQPWANNLIVLYRVRIMTKNLPNISVYYVMFQSGNNTSGPINECSHSYNNIWYISRLFSVKAMRVTIWRRLIMAKKRVPKNTCGYLAFRWYISSAKINYSQEAHFVCICELARHCTLITQITLFRWIYLWSKLLQWIVICICCRIFKNSARTELKYLWYTSPHK